MIKLIIAEDQGMVLGALSALLDLEPDMQVIGRAENGKAALELLRQQQADVLLTDIEMPEMTGLELAQLAGREFPDLGVIILTTFARSGYLRRAMDAGVRGYLLKDSPSNELAAAIRKIHKGGKVIAPELITDAWTEADPLTDRERQALRLALEGQSTDSIAQALHLSPGTVRNYLSNASAKLNASNRIEAARIARQNGWL